MSRLMGCPYIRGGFTYIKTFLDVINTLGWRILGGWIRGPGPTVAVMGVRQDVHHAGSTFTNQ